MNRRAANGTRINPIQLRVLVRNMTAHHTLLVASGVAFTCVFGLIPAMIAVVSVYGLVAEPSDVESNFRPLIDALRTQRPFAGRNGIRRGQPAVRDDGLDALALEIVRVDSVQPRDVCVPALL